jgi:hypothetical protein
MCTNIEGKVVALTGGNTGLGADAARCTSQARKARSLSIL